MQQHPVSHQTMAATFETVVTADQAIRRLRAAGFTEEELTVACPGKFKEECTCATRAAETAGAGVADGVARGGAMGAALGGLALAAAVFTGDVIAPAAVAALLVGGGAFIGGVSNLIVAKGPEIEPHDYVRQAIGADRIVVGIDIHGLNAEDRRAEAERILTDTGGNRLQRLHRATAA